MANLTTSASTSPPTQGLHGGEWRAHVAILLLQGIGAAGLMSVNIALIRLIYPPSRLGRGVGLNALVVGVGFTLGPAVASLVLSVASWPWLFAINVPLGLLALAFALPALPHTPRRGHGFDPLTAVLTSITFAALILALGAAAQREVLPLVLVPRASPCLPASCCCAGKPAIRRLCCPWICCAALCLHSRRSRRWPRSQHKVWPLFRCRFILRKRYTATRSIRAC